MRGRTVSSPLTATCRCIPRATSSSGDRVTAPALAQDEAMRRYFWDWGNRVYLFIPDAGGSLETVTDLADFCDPDLLSLANVRYLISPVRLQGDGLSQVSEDRDGVPWPMYVYENRRALPRCFLVGSIRSYPDASAVLNALSEASLEDMSSVAYLEAQDSAQLRLTRSDAPTGRVRLVTYEADAISMTVAGSAGKPARLHRELQPVLASVCRRPRNRSGASRRHLPRPGRARRYASRAAPLRPSLLRGSCPAEATLRPRRIAVCETDSTLRVSDPLSPQTPSLRIRPCG